MWLRWENTESRDNAMNQELDVCMVCNCESENLKTCDVCDLEYCEYCGTRTTCYVCVE